MRKQRRKTRDNRKPRGDGRMVMGLGSRVYWNWSPKEGCDTGVNTPDVYDNIFLSRRALFGMMRKVTVYSTQHCQYCRMVKAFLDKHAVPYENIDVGTDSR